MKLSQKVVLILMTSLTMATNHSQNYKLTDAQKKFLNKTIDSMYYLDQSNRQAFDDINSLYGVPENFDMRGSIKQKKVLGVKFNSYRKTIDSLWVIIKRNDSLNTKKLIKITKKYGFPSNQRLSVYKAKAYFIFVHTPRKFFKEVEQLIDEEYKNKRISEYQRAYIFWHLHGRGRMPPARGENGEVIWN